MLRAKKALGRREVRERAKGIRLLLLDVDGVLTDGRIVYGNAGLEVLAFHVRDGLAIKAAQGAGITVGLVSGRKSEALLRRAEELGLVEVHTGVEDKVGVYRELLMRYHLDDAGVAYMGDDLPDLPLLQRAGLAISVADAPVEVRSAAHLVTSLPGGKGAVREAVEWLLKSQGVWDRVCADFQSNRDS
ncbi:MAG: KdsC family phosphatase [Candidatus Methylomirabilales bacterium]|jgi:3-deoxy-D-manno-octulosonate 8-phosphate phosphatase (KDO 8-P phosphatase)